MKAQWVGTNSASSKCREIRPGDRYYSPTCRPWYIEQVENTKQFYIQDLYEFAGDGRLGLTFCAPIFENTEYPSAHCKDMYATLEENGQVTFINSQYLTTQKGNYVVF